MTKQKGLLLGLFLTLNWIAYCQPTDSLTEVPVPKYVLWRMFNDLRIGQMCDSLQRIQDEHIQMATQTLTVMDSIIHLQRSEIVYLDKEIRLTNDRVEAQKDINKSIDAERKRWKLTTFIGGALIILITIL